MPNRVQNPFARPVEPGQPIPKAKVPVKPIVKKLAAVVDEPKKPFKGYKAAILTSLRQSQTKPRR